MTGTNLNTEELAKRIAAGGPGALEQRLRRAYADAAAAHADIVALDDARIEAMVQSAADRADGLQWRRALAGVAADELGITVTEALSHPAVARAQALVGAPTYEQSLAELITRPVPPPAATSNGSVTTGGPAGPPVSPVDPDPEPEPEPQAHTEPGALSQPEPAAEPEPEPEAPAVPEPTAEHEVVMTPPEPDAEDPGALSDELEAIEADDEIFDLLPEPEPIELETQLYETLPAYAEEQAPQTLEPESFDADEEEEGYEDEDLRVTAVHLGGVANLPASRDGLDLRLSSNGLDILQSDEEIVGRLPWEEIDALEVPNQRTRRRRQTKARARLVVRTRHGDASFEVPGFSPDELRDRIEPLISRYGRH
jgi:hypothetical protein